MFPYTNSRIFLSFDSGKQSIAEQRMNSCHLLVHSHTLQILQAINLFNLEEQFDNHFCLATGAFMTWGPTKKLYNIAQSEYESVCVNLGAEMLSQEVSEDEALMPSNA